jgi:autophagy-related protein 11
MAFRVARVFYKRCQAILEVMAKLSYVFPSNLVPPTRIAYILPRAAERKRRQVYRGEVHGQLPFDPKGMEDAVPSIDFSPSGGKDADSLYTLERTDVSGTY